MRLSDWLEKNERSASWLARKVGVSRQTVSVWLAGGCMPSLERAMRIEKITGGNVKGDDLLPVKPSEAEP